VRPSPELFPEAHIHLGIGTHDRLHASRIASSTTTGYQHFSLRGVATKRQDRPAARPLDRNRTGSEGNLASRRGRAGLNEKARQEVLPGSRVQSSSGLSGASDLGLPHRGRGRAEQGACPAPTDHFGWQGTYELGAPSLQSRFLIGPTGSPRHFQPAGMGFFCRVSLWPGL